MSSAIASKDVSSYTIGRIFTKFGRNDIFMASSSIIVQMVPVSCITRSIELKQIIEMKALKILFSSWHCIMSLSKTLYPLISTGSPKEKSQHDCAPGHVAQSVTCLATDVRLPADPGVASSISALSHTFVEIDYEIISTVILLPSAEFKKGCFHLQAKVCAQSNG